MNAYANNATFTGNGEKNITVVMSSGTATLQQKDPGSSSWFDLRQSTSSESFVLEACGTAQYRISLTGDAAAYVG